MALLLGARNNFKAARDDGGNHNPVTDAGFVEEARRQGYLLAGADGAPVKVTRAQFPSGASYVLDGRNPEAVDWYVAQTRKWGVDGCPVTGRGSTTRSTARARCTTRTPTGCR
ncbi:hypothetical protein [Streptomyces sp. B22F1]|uniref:hypothetical protein n=1 Tax=Streptomyces sp. B22F1 TaxID=3153566 RepID=UPI00325E4977